MTSSSSGGSCITSPGVSSGRAVSCATTITCAEPRRQPVAGVVALGAQFGRGAERVGDALGRALVVGGEGDPHMAVVEDRVVLRRRPCRSGSATARSGRRARRSPP